MPSEWKNQTDGFFRNRKPKVSDSLRYWRHRWRSGILRLVERLLSGANLSDRLGGDLSQIRHLPEVSDQVLEYKVVSKAEFALPITTDRYSTVDASIPRKMGVLEECLVDFRSGLIRLDAGFILDGALPHWQRLLYQGGLAHEYKKLKKSKHKMRGTFFVIPPAKYFYHFILEDLASIAWVLSEYPNCRVLLHDDAPNWQRSVLDDLQINYVLTEKSHARVENLVFVTSPRLLTKSEINIIRSLSSIKPSDRKNRSIFLARGEKDRGDLVLENSLIEYFLQHGYEVIDPDRLTFQEQKHLFMNSVRIVALHGGALTNLLWCESGARVLEIFNHPFRTYDYAKICAQANLKYFPLNIVANSTETIFPLRLDELIPREFIN